MFLYNIIPPEKLICLMREKINITLCIYFGVELPSVMKLQYIMSCKITLHFGNKLPSQYCEITT